MVDINQLVEGRLSAQEVHQTHVQVRICAQVPAVQTRKDLQGSEAMNLWIIRTVAPGVARLPNETVCLWIEAGQLEVPAQRRTKGVRLWHPVAIARMVDLPVAHQKCNDHREVPVPGNPVPVEATIAGNRHQEVHPFRGHPVALDLQDIQVLQDLPVAPAYHQVLEDHQVEAATGLPVQEAKGEEDVDLPLFLYANFESIMLLGQATYLTIVVTTPWKSIDFPWIFGAFFAHYILKYHRGLTN